MNKIVVDILKTLYPISSIFHNTAPIEANYPLVVYSSLINVPSRRADNRTYGTRCVYRITVIDTKEVSDNDLKQAFENAGWLWEGTSVVIDTNVNQIDEVYTSIDFSILKKERN